MKNSVQVWRRQKSTRSLLGKTGTILSWTKIYVAPPEFKDFTPYPVALVELESGEKVYGQVVNFTDSELAIGQKVVSVLRILKTVGPEDVFEYGVKFQPV